VRARSNLLTPFSNAASSMPRGSSALDRAAVPNTMRWMEFTFGFRWTEKDETGVMTQERRYNMASVAVVLLLELLLLELLLLLLLLLFLRVNRFMFRR